MSYIAKGPKWSELSSNTIKEIIADVDKVMIGYKISLPDKTEDELVLSVLTIDIPGGGGVSIVRTFSITFYLT